MTTISDYTLSDEKPPIWDQLEAKFGVSWARTAVTYGDCIHSKHELLPDVEVHEACHVVQQREYGRDAWWDRYMRDVEFRKDQELMAYRVQYQWLVRNVRDRNLFTRRVHDIISSILTMYDFGFTRAQAEHALKEEI